MKSIPHAMFDNESEIVETMELVWGDSKISPPRTSLKVTIRLQFSYLTNLTQSKQSRISDNRPVPLASQLDNWFVPLRYSRLQLLLIVITVLMKKKLERKLTRSDNNLSTCFVFAVKGTMNDIRSIASNTIFVELLNKYWTSHLPLQLEKGWISIGKQLLPVRFQVTISAEFFENSKIHKSEYSSWPCSSKK